MSTMAIVAFSLIGLILVGAVLGVAWSVRSLWRRSRRLSAELAALSDDLDRATAIRDRAYHRTQIGSTHRQRRAHVLHVDTAARHREVEDHG